MEEIAYGIWILEEVNRSFALLFLNVKPIFGEHGVLIEVAEPQNTRLKSRTRDGAEVDQFGKHPGPVLPNSSVLS